MCETTTFNPPPSTLPIAACCFVSACVALLTLAGCQRDEPVPTVSGRKSAAVSSKTGSDPDAASVRVAVPQTEPPFRLVEIPSETSGIRFRHVSGNAKDKPFPAANGSGVGALDYDLDGRYDLYFATGTAFPLDRQRRDPINRMYRNLGEWRFDDVTGETGLGHNGFSSGIAVGDFDADGFPDVYVTCYGRNQFYRNCGDGTFENVGTNADGGDFSTSAAFFDYDGDGLLDLYVCNYGKWSYEQNRFCGDRTRGVRIFCSPKSLEPERDVLLRNQGDGTFHDATAEAGLDKQVGRGQGVLAADVNGDGHVDLYLGNDIHPNFLYLNQGNGRFRDASEASGTAYDGDGRMQAGMGVAGTDVDRDGRWDLFVTNFEGEHHTLFTRPTSHRKHPASAGSSNIQAHSVRIPVFNCPSNDGVVQSGNGNFTYAINMGVMNYNPGAQTNSNAGRIDGSETFHNGIGSYHGNTWKNDNVVRIRDVTDGTSSTAAYSEFVIYGRPCNRNDNTRRQMHNWASGANQVQLRQSCLQNFANKNLAEPDGSGRCELPGAGFAWSFIGNNAAYAHNMLPNENSCMSHEGDWYGSTMNAASSRHPGTVNVAFTDGSVRSVSENINMGIWWAIGTRNKSEVVGDF
jgi:prepilin-type processing-associated H-X9-DG protein